MTHIGHDPTFISGAQFALKQPAGSKEFLERVPEFAYGSGARDGHKWTMWHRRPRFKSVLMTNIRFSRATASQRTQSVPLRLIAQAFGRDEVDSACDEILAAARTACSAPQLSCTFSPGCEHPNPWYHAVAVVVEGMQDQEYEQFLLALARLGLIEAPRGDRL